MSIQIVHYQPYFLAFGVLNFKEMSDLIRPLDFGAVFPWIGMSPASQGFREQKDAAGSIPNIFAVLSGAGSRLHGN